MERNTKDLPHYPPPAMWFGVTGRLFDCLLVFHLMRRANSLEKTLKLGKIEGRRKRGRQRMRWLDGITDSMAMG